MGFLTPQSLGFNSTVGAFVGGAARGMSEQMEAAQQGEFDLAKARAAKQDALERERKKENAKLEKDGTALAYAKDVFGGDNVAALKHFMQLYTLMGPTKIPDIITSMRDQIPNLKTNATGNAPSGNDPVPPTIPNTPTGTGGKLGSIQPGANSKPNPVTPGQIGLNAPIGGTRVPSPNENFPGFNQPQNPNNQITTGPGYPANPTLDQNQLQIQPKGYADGGDVDPNQSAYLMSAGPQGTDQLPQENAPQQASTPAISYSESSSPAVMSDANPQMPQAGQQYAQAVPGTPLPFKGKSNTDLDEEYKRSQINNLNSEPARRAEQSRLEKLKLDEEKRYHDWQMHQENKNTYPPTQKLDDDYIANKTYGLNARMENLQNAQQSLADVDLLQNALNRGFRADRTQDALDNLNRFTKPVLGIDLTGDPRVLAANDIGDTNAVKKATSDIILNKLKTYHFGRILQKEVDLTTNSIANSGADPNTNVKITLLMRKAIENQMRGVLQESSIINNGGVPTSEDFAKARAVRDQNLNQMMSEDTLPWFKSDAQDVPTLQKQIAGLPVGSWVENSNKGIMYRIESHSKEGVTKLVPADVGQPRQ